MCASHLLNCWLHGASNTGEQEMVQVSLEQIQPFSLNPRVTRNPGYDVLKASIRARGLDNPPVLTRRPGDEKYMLASGGNTRLAILNELWQETQDERYHRVCWPFIGTEATRAGIIQTLLKRGYLIKQRRFLLATDTAGTLIDVLPEALKDPGTTALWEQMLDDIAAGKMGLEAFMAQQEQNVMALIKSLRHG
ncbi:DNA topoisomerase [Cronobacter malonaticus]|nr:DNA topoisomerase [Cronobacter malonaticus]MDT3536826.1 DNA topoisomerase [Cronobacter malonaticus]